MHTAPSLFVEIGSHYLFAWVDLEPPSSSSMPPEYKTGLKLSCLSRKHKDI
jgi:hypothetical protein